MKPILAILLLVILVGCATGAPPSGVERALYHVQTNYLTNVIGVVKIDTNSVVVGTNLVTNVFATYDLQPRESVVSGVQTAGAVATGFGFPLGGVIASIVLGLYGAWATWRGNRKDKLNVVLAQGTELAREVIKAVGGAPVEARFVEQIKSDQAVAGVKPDAKAVSENSVDTAKAKSAASNVIVPVNFVAPPKVEGAK